MNNNAQTTYKSDASHSVMGTLRRYRERNAIPQLEAANGRADVGVFGKTGKPRFRLVLWLRRQHLGKTMA